MNHKTLLFLIVVFGALLIDTGKWYATGITLMVCGLFALIIEYLSSDR